MTRSRFNAGFTLYELMVTVAVAGIIASFAIPSFQSFVQNGRAVTHTNDLITALNLGRSEATRRGAPINVCASTDGATCSGGTDWSTGWIMRSPVVADPVLRAWPARSGGASVLTGTSTIQFQARGSLTAAAALALQLPNCADPGRRNITINIAGRIAVNRVNCI